MKRFLVLYILVCILLVCIGPAGAAEGQTAPLESAKDLFNQISQLYEKGQRDQAKELLKPFMIHLDDANRMVARLYKAERYDDAIPIAAGIIDLQEKVLGPEHPETAAGLTNLGSLYLKTGHFDRAEDLFKTALQIRERLLGPEDLATAQSLTNLAALYQAMNQPHEAEPFYRRALAIREKILGSDHPETAISLNYLAQLYVSWGEYDQSEPFLLQILEIREKTFGPANSDTIDSLENLAEFYQFIGEWEKAEPYLTRALAARERRWGQNHPETAAGMHDLAELYRILGRYDAAESLFKKALEIRETSLGDVHPDTAATLNQLGLLYQKTGLYDKSEQVFVRALEIRKKSLEPDHPEVADSLNNLGELYRIRGTGQLAEPLFKEALVLWEKTPGADHPKRAVAMNNLALLYKERADYNQAESLYKRALVIWEKAFGPRHPDLVVSLENLAALSVARGDFAAAFEYQKKAQALDDDLIELSLGISAEDRRFECLSVQLKMAQQAIALASRHLSDSAEARRDALDIWLKRKGVTFKSSMIPEVSPGSEKNREKDRYRQLIRVRRNLARLVFGGPGLMPLEAYRDKVEKFRANERKLEQEIWTQDPEASRRFHMGQADCETIARALPEGAVLLEFARIGFDQRDPTTLENKQIDHYLAFVLQAAEEPMVELVDLGPALSIDETITVLRKEIRRGGDAKAASQLLYRQIFTNLKSRLSDSKLVYVSPDSQLSLFPFELLQDPEGRYLIEEYTFNYLTSGREIAGFGSTGHISGSPVLLAAPDFDLDLDILDAVRRQLILPPIGPFSRSRDLKGPFVAIPETMADVDEIATILNNPGMIIRTGREAIEETVYWAKAPWVLHLDTHAFLLPAQEDFRLSASPLPCLGLGITPDKLPAGAMSIQDKPRPENPHLRSGVALTGANTSLKMDDVSQSQGLLTLEKISRINLNGTDLVFLPMCETGLGVAPSGVGIYGLGEAFQQAGARSLIMSLWAVPENEKKELVRAFYKNLIQKRTPRRQALQDAILEEIEILKKRYGNNPPPIFWAAFIHLGEP